MFDCDFVDGNNNSWKKVLQHPHERTNDIIYDDILRNLPPDNNELMKPSKLCYFKNCVTSI